jgi:hypothetical protein
MSMMRKSNFALRLQPSLLEEARKLAELEGVALNQLINVAVAEKLSALRTDDYFSQRAARANLPKALKILQRAGAGKPPMTGDELRAKRGRR